jgi:DNA-binding GntR family transcriptional regulator
VVEAVSEGVSDPEAAGLAFFPQLARRNLGEEATRYLRDALLSGRYRAGEKMAVQPLTLALNISAMPVREALLTLAGEGLLEATPRRGFRVARTSVRDVQDVFRVHALVAGLLAEEAAPLFDEQGIGRLLGLQNQIELTFASRVSATERSSLIEEHNFAFHRVINHVPDAPRLRWFLRASTRYVPRHFYHQIPGWVEATRSDHPKIIDALRRHDAVEARRLVELHALEAGRLVTDNLAQKGLVKESS